MACEIIMIAQVCFALRTKHSANSGMRKQSEGFSDQTLFYETIGKHLENPGQDQISQFSETIFFEKIWEMKIYE